MQGLKCDRVEAEQVYAYDQEVEHDPSVGQLDPEREAIARKMAHTGTREKKPMIPNLTKRERKPNATKEGLVEELFKCLANYGEFEIKGLHIAEKNGKVCFKIGDKWYTWALTEHTRVIPKWIKETGGENE